MSLTFDLVKQLPTWFPGMEFKKTANAWRRILLTTIEKPYLLVREQMRRDNYSPSYLASLLEGVSDKWTPEKELVAKWTAGSLYTGGADTVRQPSHLSLPLLTYLDRISSIMLLPRHGTLPRRPTQGPRGD